MILHTWNLKLYIETYGSIVKSIRVMFPKLGRIKKIRFGRKDTAYNMWTTTPISNT